MKLIYLDSCLPCYFQGFSGITIAIPLYDSMTWNQLKSDLLLEINSIELFTSDNKPITDKQYFSIRESIDDLFNSIDDMDSLIDMIEHNESIDDDSDSVYCYLGIAE